MANLMFPVTPAPPVVVPTAVVRVVRVEPLRPIQEILAISIDDVVNDERCKRLVADFYKVTRRIENEAWLRRRLREAEDDAWVAAHL